ncbi:MAG: ABC transporter ATP-binding protein [Candidatus Hydrothermia bacterium]|jgi:ATP-binding cassette subfamily B protein|nr:ABC transporter ATP-binding protein [Candidatus Hydrothermia bacterium]
MIELIKLKWKKYLLGSLILIVVDLGQLIVPIIIAIVIDKIAKFNITSEELFKYFLILILIAFGVAFLRFFWRFFIVGAAREIERDLRKKIYKHVLKLHVGYFDENKTGDIMAKATNDLEAIRMALSMGIVSLSDAIIYTSFSIVAMFLISYKLTLMSIIPLILLAPISFVLGKIIEKKFRKVQDTFGDLSERARETLEGINVVKAYTREEEFLMNFKKISLNYLKANMDLARTWGLYEPIIRILAGISIIIVLGFGGYWVIKGEITIGKITAFFAYLNMLIWPMLAIGWSINLFQRGIASYKRVIELLNEKPLIFSKPNSYKGSIVGNIKFSNLTFYYDNKKVLDNVSFEIKNGQKVGIIGRIGSGKSTILKILIRLYNPPKNSIFIDGIDINEWDLFTLRNEIAYVPQESYLFSTTIRENILIGNPKANDEEIWEALELADIKKDIEKLPYGLDTIIGERGITLSGGQKQRLALARALIKRPKILLLDDTLSAVDNETENNILRNLQKYMSNMTVIIVSHKISAVMDCDFIIVLENGRIKEMGTHEELIKLGGFYYSTYSMQKYGTEIYSS